MFPKCDFDCEILIIAGRNKAGSPGCGLLWCRLLVCRAQFVVEAETRGSTGQPSGNAVGERRLHPECGEMMEDVQVG